MADVGFLEVLLLCVEYGGDDFLDGHPEVKVMSAKQGRMLAQQAITYISLSVWFFSARKKESKLIVVRSSRRETNDNSAL